MKRAAAPVPRRRLELVPAGGVASSLLAALGAALDAALGTAHVVADAIDLPSPAEPPSQAVRSDAVVDALLARAAAAKGGDRALRLAVVEAPLRSPEGERVFGEAAVGGGCAVVGLGGLDGGSGCDETTLLDRAAKTALHELGHAAGLEHCADPTCVMYPSRGIADTDRKATRFCRRCAADLLNATLDAARS